MNVSMAWIPAMTMLLAVTQSVASTASVTLGLREMESTAAVSLISVFKTNQFIVDHPYLITV